MGATKRLYVEEQMRRDVLIEDTKMVEVSTKLTRHSNRAIMISLKVSMVHIKPWIPKSQILEPDHIALDRIEPESALTMIIPLWLAKSNGLIYKEVKKYD